MTWSSAKEMKNIARTIQFALLKKSQTIGLFEGLTLKNMTYIITNN